MSEVTDAPARTETSAQAAPLQGSHIWYELMTPDPDGAKAFYDAVVGWDDRRAGARRAWTTG